MPKPEQSDAAKSGNRSQSARVAVVGGGLAGMTSALRLARCGFQVTLFEAADRLGGNLSSSSKELHAGATIETIYYDVYPHMFCEWYSNFWDIFEEDLGLSRDEAFEPRSGVKILERGTHEFIHLENATSLSAILSNLNSGLASWPDVFLLGFSMIDLASTPFDRNRDDELENIDVNGFVYSRGYSTQAVAQLQNYILMLIWSIQSELTAASSYQDFIKHTIAYPRPTPFCYLLKGPLQTRIIDPFEAKLLSLRLADGSPACVIRKNHPVNRIELDKKRNRRPNVYPAVEPNQDFEEFDYLVLAAPAGVVAQLSLEGEDGSRIVDCAPHLSQLQRLRGEAIPVLNLYFKRKLDGLPKEIFALAGSKLSCGQEDPAAHAECDCDMTALDISQLWTGDRGLGDCTVLSVAASNRYALPATSDEDIAFLMLQHLHEYLGNFAPGKYWGDKDSDVDWRRTGFRSNNDRRLFLDEVGTWNIRPNAAQPDCLPYVFFAGDYCRTDVDMATIEAAVQSGHLAAQAIQQAHQHGAGVLVGPQIASPLEHAIYSDTHFLAIKLALLPLAYAATALSAYLNPVPGEESGKLPANAYSPRSYAMLLPLAFTLDWWKTAYWLARRIAPPLSEAGLRGLGPSEAAVSLVNAAGRSAIAALSSLAEPRATEAAPAGQPGDRLIAAFGLFADQAWRTTRTAWSEMRQFANPAGEARRRARVKL